MTLEEARTMLAALESAILSGTNIVEISGPAGRRIQYQNLDEMRIVADQLRRDIQRREGRPSSVVVTW